MGLILSPILRKLAFRLNVLDRGEGESRNHEAAVPRLGGVAILLAFILPLVFNSLSSSAYEVPRRFLIILSGAFLVFAIGIYDDIKGASVWSRLGVEFAAALMVYSSGVRIDFVPDFQGGVWSLGWSSMPVTVLWIVIITNALNLIDGLDGLAAGTGVLILLTILFLNLNRLDHLLVLGVFSLLGALLGFLFYNFPPASLYMGDSGSLFLGFFLSSFALLVSSGAPGSKIVWITALAFALPLLDMVYAVLRRWYRGVPIYTSDRDHLHHKLLGKGLSKRKVLLFFYGANLILMLALVFLVKNGSKPLLMFFILFILSLAAFTAFQFLSDLKPADFAQKIFLLFRLFRRRRYYSYLINCFERNIEKKKQFPDVLIYLDKLFADYGMLAAEIHSSKGLLYIFGNRVSGVNVWQFEFPLTREGICFGRVILQKRMGGEQLFCSCELADILNKYLGKLIHE
jgi:UDP-GlcNAc:undecaprenyl-phosphate/decaprenyl-phosphate GlcNAc-1-phosphate transferase